MKRKVEEIQWSLVFLGFKNCVEPSKRQRLKMY